jgi:hypothetical protein
MTYILKHIENISLTFNFSLKLFQTMQTIKTKKEALDFVLNQLHTCRMIDTTWDEYMELILRLGIVDRDKKHELYGDPKPFFSKIYWYLLFLFLSLFLLQMT